TVVAVRALDTTSAEAVTLSPAQCGFAYRDSAFKSREPGRYVVLAVTYRLRPGGAPMLGYADVARDVAAPGMPGPTHRDVRAAVPRARVCATASRVRRRALRGQARARALRLGVTRARRRPRARRSRPRHNDSTSARRAAFSRASASRSRARKSAWYSFIHM